MDGPCERTGTVSIAVRPKPQVTVTGPSTVCTGGTAVLNATGASSYSWSTGGSGTTLQLTGLNTHGVYHVIGTDTITGCSDTASLAIEVLTCTGIENVQNEKFRIFWDNVNGEVLIGTNEKIFSISVLDLSGRELPASVKNDRNGFRVSLDGIARGLYILEIEAGTTLRYKLLK